MSWLQRTVDARGSLAFGELLVEPAGNRSWRVAGPRSDAGARKVTISAIRERATHDDEGRYRPLAGARSLPGGWYAEAADNADLEAALEEVYPLATRHISQAAEGTLRTCSLDAVLTRQSGRYAAAKLLSPRGRAKAIDVVCGACVRTPAWDKPADDEDGAIPCPEACSVLVAFCREAQRWEADPPEQAPADPEVAFADFETAGNALREAYLAGSD